MEWPKNLFALRLLVVECYCIFREVGGPTGALLSRGT